MGDTLAGPWTAFQPAAPPPGPWTAFQPAQPSGQPEPPSTSGKPTPQTDISAQPWRIPETEGLAQEQPPPETTVRLSPQGPWSTFQDIRQSLPQAAYNRFLRGAVEAGTEVIAGVPRALARPATVDPYTGAVIPDRTPRAVPDPTMTGAAEAVERGGQQLASRIPIDPRWQDHPVVKTAGMIGGAAPLLAAGTLGALAGGPAGAAAGVGVTAFSQGFESTFTEAQKAKATPNEAFDAAYAGGLVSAGVMELPAAQFLRSIAAPFRRAVVTAIADRVANGATMITANQVQQLADNVIAQQTYEPTRPTMQGVGQDIAEQGAAGVLIPEAARAGHFLMRPAEPTAAPELVQGAGAMREAATQAQSGPWTQFQGVQPQGAQAPAGGPGIAAPAAIPIAAHGAPPDVVAAAQASEAAHGIPASVTLAQWAQESGYGQHMPPGSNNPFGIKARAGEPYVEAPTREVINGQSVTVNARFRKFDSLTDAFDAHAKLLAEGAPYAAARELLPDTEAFTREMAKSYATDPTYGAKLVQLERQFRGLPVEAPTAVQAPGEPRSMQMGLPFAERATTDHPQAPEQSQPPFVGAPELGQAADTLDRIASGQAEQSIFTNSGSRITAQPEIRELQELVASHLDDGRLNPAFPHEEGVQPRDRANAASQAQIRSIATNLQPERLGISPDASTGAPIIGPNGVVESGNGRVLAMQQVFADPSLEAQRAAYLSFLTAQGYDPSRFRQPVLVARRTSDLSADQTRQFVREANERNTLAMNAGEQARVDADRAGRIIGSWSGEDASSAANRDFVRQFMGQLSPEERGAMMLPDGGLSAEGARRIQSAVASHAYGEELGPILDRFLNSDAEGMKAIAGALSDAAGEWAKMRDAAGRGTIPPELDITPALGEAVRTIARARQLGRPVSELVGQADIENPPISPEGEALLRSMYRDQAMRFPAARAKVAVKLADYAAEARAQLAAGNLFGQAPASAGDILAALGAKGEREAGLAAAASKRMLSKREEMPSFEEMKRRDREYKATAKQMAGAGRPARFRDSRYGLDFLVSPDLNHPGGWRTTTFRDGVPQGHVEHDTAYDAFLENLRRHELLPQEQRRMLSRRDESAAEHRANAAADAKNLSPEAQAARVRLYHIAQAVMRFAGLPREVGLKFVDRIIDAAGNPASADGSYTRGLIEMALDTPPDQVPGKLFHEITHGLLDPSLGLLNDSQRRALMAGADRFLAQNGMRQRIADLYGVKPNDPIVREEAVARLAEQALERGLKPQVPIAQAATRMVRFVQGVGQALRGQGFRTADDVFDAMLRGEQARPGAREQLAAAAAPGEAAVPVQNTPQAAPIVSPSQPQGPGIETRIGDEMLRLPEKYFSRREDRPGIIAYHGSPHDFDRFDMSKIGTGEGAQSYGHGLYFAGNEAVARGYRDKLSLQPMDQLNTALTDFSPYKSGGPQPTLVNLQAMLASHPDKILQTASGDAPFMRDLHTMINGHDLNTNTWSDAASKAASRIDTYFGQKSPGGHMYEARLHVDPNALLDWDRPIREQPTAQQALRSTFGDIVEKTPTTGGGAYKELSTRFAEPSAITKLLRDSGVPGIKYLDAGSRAAGEGSRNYVMLSADPIEILRKYSLRDEVAREGLKAAEKSRTIRDSIMSALSPMTAGTPRAQASAAQFANNLRYVGYQFGKIDRHIEKKYTPSDREQMGRAMDAQSVFEQQLARGRDAEPGVAPGFVRFYHGGAEPDGSPRWVSPDRAYAEGYAAKSGSRTFYVDVPEGSPLLQKTFDDTGASIKAPYASFEAPSDIASNLKPTVGSAADESALRAQFDAGRTGVAGLSDKQRGVVEQLAALGNHVWQRMQDREMVPREAAGLPYYFARQIVMHGDEGLTNATGQGGTRDITGLGRNLNTAGPGRREHLTPEETEAAAKAKLGQGATLVRDIRSVVQAMARQERAIAGRDFLDAINRVGELTGVNTVVHGDIPGLLNPADYFTMNHPSFRRWTGSGFQQIHISKEFEGPLKAVLTQPESAWYRAMMTGKGGVMNMIMYSPFMHLGVELSRAFPMMPGKMLMALQPLRDGSRVRQDPGYMEHAVRVGGVAPIGQGWSKDPASIANEANVENRGLFARMFSPITRARDAVAGAVERTTGSEWWGDVMRHPHQTLLWDQVFNLQMGIYDHLLQKFMDHGFERDAAAVMAGHIANRYAGALPPEHLSHGANMAANLLLFSRSFTLGNLGVIKDMFNGAPAHVRARIDQIAGPEVANNAAAVLRNKARLGFTIDLGLYMIGNALLQQMVATAQRASTMGLPAAAQSVLDEWERSAGYSLSHLGENPMNLFGVLPGMHNEPGKADRVYLGNDSTGRGIYLRPPTGKIGEEFLGWFLYPATMVTNKLSPFARPVLEAIMGQDTLGRPIYRPHPATMGQWIENAGMIATHLVGSQFPWLPAQGAWDVATGQTQGDRGVAAAKVLAPMAGLGFVSSGYPGGPEAGVVHEARVQREYDIRAALPEVNRLAQSGKMAEARKVLSDIDVTGKDAMRILRHAQNPSAAAQASERWFAKHATPEQRGRMVTTTHGVLQQ